MQIKNFTVYRGDNTNLQWQVTDDLTGKILLFAVKSSKIINAVRIIEKTPTYESGYVTTTLTAPDTQNILHQNLYYDLINVTHNTTIATGKIILQADVITKADGYLQGQIDDDSINNYTVWSSDKTNNQILAESTARQNADSNLQTQITTLNTHSHTHSNKSLLDSYNQTNADITDAITKKHSHTNQTILDNTSESFTSALKSNYNNHLTNTNNPHAVTKTQIGLNNVSNDAQLKRADGDFNSFTEKSSLSDNDLILIEDSESAYSKKKSKIITIQNKLDTRYAIQQTFAPPQGVIFDGVRHYYTIADNNNHQFTENTKFAFECLFIQTSNLSTSGYGAYIIGKSIKYGIGVYNKSGNNILLLGIKGTTEKNTYYDDRIIELNKLYHIIFNYDGANSNYWINGIKYTKDFSGSGLTDGSGELYLGYYTLAGTPAYFPGIIYKTKVYNRTLTDNEVVKYYNNGLPHLAHLDYTDTNASNTLILNNPNNLLIDGSGWVNNLDGSYTTNGTTTKVLYKSNIYAQKKRYRLTFTVTAYTSGNLRAIDYNANILYNFNVTGTGTYTGEFITTVRNDIFYIAPYPTINATISNINLQSIGSVAEYIAENAGTMGWLETQNGLHAISSGNPIAPIGLRDYKSGISTTAVQFINSQKAQTILKQIIVKNNYAGSNTVSLGTTTNANELLNAVALANSETKVIDVNSYSATERSLYAKAGASNIDITLIFDKVAR